MQGVTVCGIDRVPQPRPWESLLTGRGIPWPDKPGSISTIGSSPSRTVWPRHSRRQRLQTKGVRPGDPSGAPSQYPAIYRRPVRNSDGRWDRG